jgi:hypothetical protein
VSKVKVGEIINVYNGCCDEYYTKADKFIINFPAEATLDQKLVITYAALSIDYDHFEGHNS